MSAARVLVSSLSLCVAAGLPSTVSAGVAMGLYNPFNHGYLGVNEIGSNRVDIITGMVFVEGDGGFDTDYVFFQPFYGSPADTVYLQRYWQMERYDAYRVINPNPYASPFRNLHLTPAGAGGDGNTTYFDKLEEHSSAQGSAGFSASSGTFNLSSPTVDTGIGQATGFVTSAGKMGLKVNIDGSFGSTPVSEGALQATFTDTFTVNGSGPTAATKISFSAHAVAPVLDFSRGDFYNYAVGYQVSVFQRGPVPSLVDEDGNVLQTAPGITEYWADSGFHWMDARLVRGSNGFADTIRIETLGDAPPGVAGVDYQQEYIGTYGALDGDDAPPAYQYVREIAVDPSDPSSLIFDDPQVPFSKSSVSARYVINPLTGEIVNLGDIELPTGVELEMMVNFFVVAGCSDSDFGHCQISMDGSQTAAVGIAFDDPTVSLTSRSGFAYPTAAVPEPSTWVSLLGGAALLGALALRRKGAGLTQTVRIR